MRSSLLAKVSLIIISLLTITGVLTGLLVYTNSSKALKSSISSNLSAEANQTMDKIDRFLYERLVDIQQLTGRQQLQVFLAQPATRTSDSSAKLIKQLNGFKVLVGTWSDLFMVDRNGNIVLTTDEPKVANELARQSEFKDLFSTAVKGQIGYSNVILEGSSGHAIMLFISPIRDTQTPGQPIIGALVGELAWPAVLETTKGLGSTAVLIKDNGASLGTSESSSQDDILSRNFTQTQVYEQIKKSDSGTAVTNGLIQPGARYLTAFTREKGYLDYKGNNWTLVLQTPESSAFASSARLAANLGVIYLGILTLSIGFLLIILTRQVIQPIANLKEVVNRLSRGDFSLRATIDSRDELGDLSQGFNDMADKIQFAYINLKQSTEIALNERNILQTLLNNLPVGVLVVSAPDGKPIMMNGAGQTISGRDARGDINSQQYTKAYDVIKEDGQAYPDEDLPLTITLKTGRTMMKDDMLLRRPDGTSVAVRAITTPIRDRDGRIRRAVSVFEDISKERNLERSREEFFSIASHELRTPLTAIRGNSDMIQQYYGDKLDDPNLKEMISDIHESANRLIAIVNDFLDTSRLEQKRMKFEYQPVDLLPLSEAVVKEYQVTGSRQKIHLETQRPVTALPPVWADSNRLKQVLINLIGNAMKFTEQGSVVISFEIQPTSIKILITDTGRGMSLGAQQLLFKKFEQTGSTVLTRDSVRGTGLGLYISKMIIEQMHGQIKLERSELGKGTTFSFSIPLATAEHSADPSHPDILMGKIKG